MNDIRKKSAQSRRAIRERCLDCAGGSAAIHACDGKMIGYACALWPYRGSSVPKTGPDGRMLDHFRKSEVLKAIRRECRFCCNDTDPRLACGDPSCTLAPYQRGTRLLPPRREICGERHKELGSTETRTGGEGDTPVTA